MDPSREIELKLEAAPADLRRLLRHPLVLSLSEGRAVTRALDTVYFDTPDDALSAAGFALRIRRIGAQRVQTVKGERTAAGGLFDRLEVETPVEGDTPDLSLVPDPELGARLRACIGDAPLEPVFRTVFKRTRRTLRSDGNVWTLDFDEGEIVAGDARAPIQEIELELREGEPARLLEFALLLLEQADVVPGSRSKAERGYALARGMPAQAFRERRIDLERDASVETVLEVILGQCLAHFTRNAACAREGVDPEGVHQMRIGARRARAALAVFRPVLPDGAVRRLRSELRWLGRELGPARDLDVFTREVLPPIARDAGDEPAFKRLAEEASALRADCYAGVRAALDSSRYARLVLELGAWLQARAWRNQAVSEESSRLFAPARDFASELLSRRERRVRRLEKRLGESDEARHALRIELKKLRYGAEFFRDLFPERHPKRTLRRIARVQGALGRLNDVVSARGILETLLARLGEERAPAHDRAAGFVEGWTSRVAAADLEAFEEAAKRLRRTKPFWRG